jgi:hypothetical protein
MMDFSRKRPRRKSAVFGNFRSKKRAKRREVQALFSAKTRFKKSLSSAYRAASQRPKYWQPDQ